MSKDTLASEVLKQWKLRYGGESKMAHIQARNLLLEVATGFERDSLDDSLRVFAGAVKAYLEAEVLEPCLHLHAGKPVGPWDQACRERVESEDTCGKVALSTGYACNRPKGHTGSHRLHPTPRPFNRVMPTHDTVLTLAEPEGEGGEKFYSVLKQREGEPARKCWNTGLTDPGAPVGFYCGLPEGHKGAHAYTERQKPRK